MSWLNYLIYMIACGLLFNAKNLTQTLIVAILILLSIKMVLLDREE